MVEDTNIAQELELVLLRLFRCMRESQQCELIAFAVAVLSRRSVDEAHQVSDAGQQADDVEAAEERVLADWPGDWPERSVVDLDNVGDPGDWLSEILGEPILQVLFGWSWDDVSSANTLAQEFLRTIREAGYPLPSDFDEDSESTGDGWTESDEAQATTEFVGFLRHWRERVMKSIEKQKPTSE